jgi:uncharacterized protein (AIM24 family)
MEPQVYGLRTGIFGGTGNLVFNRFTGPGRVGIQSMYMDMSTSSDDAPVRKSAMLGGALGLGRVIGDALT